jgi:hypothetical protein
MEEKLDMFDGGELRNCDSFEGKTVRVLIEACRMLGYSQGFNYKRQETTKQQASH